MDAKFWKYHEENPEIFERLVEMTKAAKARGRKHVGMKMMFEVIRWEQSLTAKSDIFKINNNYTSRYARLITDTYPELYGMFETRRIRS